MSQPLMNKYRVAIDVLQKGRESLVSGIADDVLDQTDVMLEGGYQFNEYLENQGTRLHFLSLLIGQLESSADQLDEELTAPPPPPSCKSKPRSAAKKGAKAKKVRQEIPAEGSTEDH